jgi:hypothetical protein
MILYYVILHKRNEPTQKVSKIIVVLKKKVKLNYNLTYV